MTEPILTPSLLLRGYANGIFPMAESRDDPEVFWVDPKRRGVLPLDGFHMSRSLARAMRRCPWKVRLDHDFEAVVDGCADRVDTWINPEIRRLYMALHMRAQAHSFELWDGPDLVGGVYGVVLGGAFFGESMFSRRTNASKIALAVAVDHLRRCGFVLFDTQFLTEHLASLGAIEISRSEYRHQLAHALDVPARLKRTLSPLQDVVQRMTQTS
ncbi:leucyl/phenylalanyl-tRNA--protein transferase [Tateyamaria sp. SN6-1]|uniref:leucyl/phenylalanyl-tRNA--protein transferase n=1 Tax=Tateyamaria sp. SN6-1 TaxID=3092148 RepID=UPI0039F50B03